MVCDFEPTLEGSKLTPTSHFNSIEELEEFLGMAMGGRGPKLRAWQLDPDGWRMPVCEVGTDGPARTNELTLTSTEKGPHLALPHH